MQDVDRPNRPFLIDLVLALVVAIAFFVAAWWWSRHHPIPKSEEEQLFYPCGRAPGDTTSGK